jgi:hypothetical protein
VIRSLLKKQIENFWETIGVKLEICRKRTRLPEAHRFDYQKRYIDFNIQPGMRVLDMGSGGDPFPNATVLVDGFMEPILRGESLVVDRPFVLADICQLPFPDKAFDFVYSAHVLEELEDPIQASKELMRVGKRGYVETPALAKDMLFAWAKGIQKWHVVSIGSTLCFFEYSKRQLDGINSNIFRQLILGKWEHPLQKTFSENQDLFNVMFLWEHKFSVYVFYLDGSVRILDESTESPNTTIPASTVEYQL